MNFKNWFNEAVTLNPLFYDMNTEKGRQEYEKDLAELQAWHLERSKEKIVSKTEIVKPVTITCWRGFNEKSLIRDTISQGPGWRIIDGKSAMENMLWFTHDQQQRINPKEYAISHAEDYLLTYPLNAKMYYDEVKFNNGRISKDIPERFQNLDTSSLNNKAILEGVVYELPQGWYFTWQIQKHIGCKIPIKITDNMLQKVS